MTRWALVWGVAATACSGSSASDRHSDADTDLVSGDTDAADTDRVDTDAADTDGSDDPGSCVAPGFGASGAAMQVDDVDATFVDLDGHALAGVYAQVCDTSLCFFNGTTGADGHLSIHVGQSLVQPALVFGGGSVTTSLLARITQATTSFGSLTTAVMPDAGATLTPGSDATSNGVTIGLAAQATISIDTLNYDTPDKQEFRALEMPLAAVTAVTAGSPGFAEVFAVSPLDTLICPRAVITVPNTAALPANASVEFWVQGSDASMDWAPFGAWAKISDGKVSADGQTISTSAHGGLPVLMTFGVRQP